MEFYYFLGFYWMEFYYFLGFWVEQNHHPAACVSQDAQFDKWQDQSTGTRVPRNCNLTGIL